MSSGPSPRTPPKDRDVKKRVTKERAQRQAVGRKVRQAAKPVKPKPVTLHLQRGHSINGNHYGPGPVTVSRYVADVLLENERRAAAENARFFDKEPPDRVIGGKTQGGYKMYRLGHGALDGGVNLVAPVMGSFSGR